MNPNLESEEDSGGVAITYTSLSFQFGRDLNEDLPSMQQQVLSAAPSFQPSLLESTVMTLVLLSGLLHPSRGSRTLRLCTSASPAAGSSPDFGVFVSLEFCSVNAALDQRQAGSSPSEPNRHFDLGF